MADKPVDRGRKETPLPRGQPRHEEEQDVSGAVETGTQPKGNSSQPNEPKESLEDPSRDNEMASPPTQLADQPNSETHTRGLVGWWKRLKFRLDSGRDESRASLEKSISISEVRALIHFVSENGLDPEAKFTGPANDAVNSYELETDAKAKRALETNVLVTYSGLAGLTYPSQRVNGRTILSTEHVTDHLKLIIFWGVVFFGLAAATQILGNWYVQLGIEPEIGPGKWLFDFHQLVLVYLFPFFWGGLGACIYLAKTIADKAAGSSFDMRKLRGQSSRIFLGAILGAVVVNLFFENVSRLSVGFESIGPAGVAFLTGLGVKVVYGAFQKMLDGVHDTIQSINIGKTPGTP